MIPIAAKSAVPIALGLFAAGAAAGTAIGLSSKNAARNANKKK